MSTFPSTDRNGYDAGIAEWALLVADLSQLTPADFEPLIGSDLPLLDSPYAFTLQAVKRLASPSPRAEPFTLSLLAPANTQGTQGNYTVVHPALGALSIFIVPVSVNDGRTSFEAIFN